MSEIVTEKVNIKTHKDLDVWKKSIVSLRAFLTQKNMD